MNILLHSCCGPCATYPVKKLQEMGHDVSGFFYNPNIHPYKEYEKRLLTFQDYAKKKGIKTIIKDDYALEKFLRMTAYRENIRCQFCYRMRLDETAKLAKEQNFEAFSTTLLVSPYQKHELIKKVGEELAEEYQISFFYHDFRDGYREGVNISREMGLYRQPFCGCIYSERDRYRKERK
ncbi:MAG: epoxyqueuosine reductase QueH [Bacillota bacterium]|jgi:predicted adenine nucleotide alpha hydrolase (AANH) superfamily ATPase